MNTDLAKSRRAGVADFYETHAAAFSQTRTFVWPEERLVAARIDPKMTVVDIGAGNGRFARLLPRDTTYIGIEPSAGLRAHAPSLDLRPGGFPHIPLPDRIADVTVCFAVFHHLLDQEERLQAFEELLRVTKPGGLIALTSWIGANHPQAEPLIDGLPGDDWIPWKKEGASAKRFVHTLTREETGLLVHNPDFLVETATLFGKETATQTLAEARNWFILGTRR